MKLLFESVTCSRCSGTGKYSYNLMHGDRCYGCAGVGEKLTKRGAAASRYYRALRERPAAQVGVGDLIEFDMFFWKGFKPVESVEFNEGRVTLTTTRNGERAAMTYEEDRPVLFGFTAEQKRELQAQALRYQETLTQTGAPRKSARPQSMPTGDR